MSLIQEIEQRQQNIKEELVNINALIAKVKALPAEVIIPAATIQLADGERYAGIIVGKDGEKSYHLILLPGEKESIKWSDAYESGDLPTRREQSLLYANLKEEFESAWYWSSEQHSAYSNYAWTQTFSNGPAPRLQGQRASRPVRPQIRNSVI